MESPTVMDELLLLFLALFVSVLLAWNHRASRYLYPLLLTLVTGLGLWLFAERNGVHHAPQSISLGFDAAVGQALLLAGVIPLGLLVLRLHRRIHERHPARPRWPRLWRATLLHLLGITGLGVVFVAAGWAAVLMG